MARSVVPGTASRILVHHVLSRFSLQTCTNRNERHPAPVSYGSVHQHPFRCESAIGDLACLSCHGKNDASRHPVRAQGDDPASPRHLRIERTLAETDVHDEELIL